AVDLAGEGAKQAEPVEALLRLELAQLGDARRDRPSATLELDGVPQRSAFGRYAQHVDQLHAVSAEEQLDGLDREGRQVFVVQEVEHLVPHEVAEVEALEDEDAVGSEERPDRADDPVEI